MDDETTTRGLQLPILDLHARGEAPEGLELVAVDEASGGVSVRGRMQFHSIMVIHEDVRHFPTFAATDVLELTADRVARDLVRYIVSWARKHEPAQVVECPSCRSCFVPSKSEAA
jgi:hypothetical protein